MASPPASAAPSPVITSQPGPSTPSFHRPSHDQGREPGEPGDSNAAPYTPTSAGTPGSVPQSAAPSRRQSTHQKSNSVPAPPRTSIGSATRPLSPHKSEGEGAERAEESKGKAVLGMDDTQRLLGIKLPPSPPLTDRDVDPETDGPESIQTHSQAALEREEDITAAWRTSQEPHAMPGSSTRASHDVPRFSFSDPLQHPLADPRPTMPSGEADLEKGPELRENEEPAMGVTKPFEIVRSQHRLSIPKPPKSSYYMGPPAGPTAYYTPPVGQLGVHHPREIVRIERDYDHGELVQFSSAYPLELQGRITPTQFLETINVLNEGLIRAHSITAAAFYNVLAILTFWLSPLFVKSRYEREMERLAYLIDALNAEVYNPVGLNILWPRRNAFLFLEIEYY